MNTVLLEKIIYSNEFKQFNKLNEKVVLEEKRRDFNIIKLFVDKIDENALSRIFSYLFHSDEDHELGDLFLHEWLEITNSLLFNKDKIGEKVFSVFAETEVPTDERRRIDILVKINDNAGSLIAVVAFENKIYASERDKQVSDYQDYLKNRFPNIPKEIYYLTPDGKESVTAIKNHDCPCINASYLSFSEVCKNLYQRFENKNSSVLLRQLSSYLETFQTNYNMDKELRKVITNFLQDEKNRNAIDEINKVLDSFPSLKSKLKEKIEISLDNNGFKNLYEYDTYSNSEVQITFDDLDRKQNFGICFMIKCDSSSPSIGDKFLFLILAIPNNWEKNNKVRLTAFRNEIKKSSLVQSDSKTSLKDWWNWTVIYSGDSYTLSDLGEQDLEELSSLLLNGIKSKYKIIEKELINYSK